MTLIFLLTYCPDFEECFSYPEYVFKMISHHSTVIWSKSSRKRTLKNVLELIFGSVQKSLFDTFRRELLLQMAVEWWEMNLETCSGYEKHSSGSGQYVSKKIRVIRRVKKPFKMHSEASRKFCIFSSFEGIFAFKWL